MEAKSCSGGPGSSGELRHRQLRRRRVDRHRRGPRSPPPPVRSARGRSGRPRTRAWEPALPTCGRPTALRFRAGTRWLNSARLRCASASPTRTDLALPCHLFKHPQQMRLKLNYLYLKPNNSWLPQDTLGIYGKITIILSIKFVDSFSANGGRDRQAQRGADPADGPGLPSGVSRPGRKRSARRAHWASARSPAGPSSGARRDRRRAGAGRPGRASPLRPTGPRTRSSRRPGAGSASPAARRRPRRSGRPGSATGRRAIPPG